MAIFNIAAQQRRFHRIRRIDDIGRGVQKLGEAAETGNALWIGLDDRIDLFHRPEKHAHQQQEADKAAFGQAARQHEPGAADHHDHLRQPHAHVA